MSGPGTRWRLPNGRDAIEWPGSTRDVLRLAEIIPNYPFPQAPRDVVRSLCTRAPSQVRRVGALVAEVGEALL